MDIKEYLKHVYIFSDLTDEEVELLIPHIVVQYFDDTQLIFSEGNAAEALYIIVSGMVKITKRIDEKREKTLTQIKPTLCFGEMALLDGNVRSASAKAVGSTTLITFTKVGFDTLTTNHTETGMKILMRLSILLSKRLRETNDQIVDILQLGLK
jgi:CRP/FNR family transcriptional regulator, cyclic AMP receptor protein